jgi:hypothetical protein
MNGKKEMQKLPVVVTRQKSTSDNKTPKPCSGNDVVVTLKKSTPDIAD